LLADHHHLAQLITQLRASVNVGDEVELQQPWNEFEDALREHLEAEEKFLLPMYAHVAPDQAAALHNDHMCLIELLECIGLDVELHFARREKIDLLLDFLRRHSAREEAGLYRWAEESVTMATWESIRSHVPRLFHSL
jgi:hemerythrin-like domain-containing protein